VFGNEKLLQAFYLFRVAALANLGMTESKRRYLQKLRKLMLAKSRRQLIMWTTQKWHWRQVSI